MPPSNSQRASFFPKADAAVLQSKYDPPSPTSRPTKIGPILDASNADKAIDAWSEEFTTTVYPSKTDLWALAPIPTKPEAAATRYLFPVLTRNERLRLTMLFYYTRGALEDPELVSRLQEKVHLAKETVGWEFVIAGVIDHNSFTRLATVGLPLAVLPRRESTCSHTVNQPPGTVFTLKNMLDDWRFQKSPHVEQGGLRAYAGVPLSFETEFNEHVAFGSLCVASNSEQNPLSKEQQTSLARLADWIVADIIHSARTRRQQVRRRMQELVSAAQKCCDQDECFEEAVLEMLHEIYPEAMVKIQTSIDGQILLEGRAAIPISELEHGLWEDSVQFDNLIENFNHRDPVASQVVRIIAAECENASSPTFLIVGSKDFRIVFDDVDSWFVHTCASLLSRSWQNRALKEALTAKENFFRGITHQLRTPIHGILGSVELLAEELKSRKLIDVPTKTPSPPITPNAEHLDPYLYIRTIRNSAKELITTVNSMIKLNRWAEIAQAERIVALHQIAEIESRLLNETLLVMPDDSRARPSIIFTHQLPPDCEHIVLDVSLLIDCILPLVLNAVQNTAGGVVAVTTSVTDDYETLTIDVEDTGCGISPEDQTRIFHPYEKVDTHTTGAGLGLTLAWRLASLMDGSISLVSSQVGNGSHFRATFNEVICASSLQRSRALKAKFAHLPPTFYRVPMCPKASTLESHFCKFLTNSGYTESMGAEGAIQVIDYSPNLVQLHRNVSHIGTSQAVICLVPEFETLIDFGGGQIRRESNVIYAKGPFFSDLLAQILEEADRMLAEMALQPSESAVEIAPMVTSLDNTLDSTLGETPLPAPDKDLSSGLNAHQDSFLPNTAPPGLLADCVQKLHIEDPPPALLKNTSKKSTKPMTLLVDDNAINLRLLEMYCSRRGIPHCTAVDGQRAIHMFSRHQSPSTAADLSSPSLPSDITPIELVLMDLQMPVCDGIAATRQIRALEKEHGWKRCVILIVTGQDSPSDRTAAEQAGADGFLVKPVGPKVLDGKIRQYFSDSGLG